MITTPSARVHGEVMPNSLENLLKSTIIVEPGMPETVNKRDHKLHHLRRTRSPTSTRLSFAPTLCSSSNLDSSSTHPWMSPTITRRPGFKLAASNIACTTGGAVLPCGVSKAGAAALPAAEGWALRCRRRAAGRSVASNGRATCAAPRSGSASSWPMPECMCAS